MLENIRILLIGGVKMHSVNIFHLGILIFLGIFKF